MQFIDLKAQYQSIENKIQARIQQVLERGDYIMGQEVAELEQALADYVGVRHCITCANGTDALQLALMAAGVGSGDRVLTTAYSFFATAEVIELIGATPEFVDIDPVTFNIDVAQVGRRLSDAAGGIKAVIAVDLFGLAADYAELETLCLQHNALLIEDGAQSFGASQDGRVCGSFGDLATTSFFPAKPLGCYGDGGALFTNNGELARVLKSLRVHGKGEDKYDNVRIGLNSRLDTLQAAILLEKFAVFPEELKRRQQVARQYSEALNSCLQVPRIPGGYLSAWAQYCLQADSSEQREQIMADLSAAGVPTAIYYPKPLHLQTAFRGLGYREGDFPVSEAVSQRIFSIPMHPYLDSDAIDRVITACRKAVLQ